MKNSFDTMPMPVTSFIKEAVANLQQRVDKIVKEEMPKIKNSGMNYEAMNMVLIAQSTRARVLMDVIDSFNKMLE